MKLTPTERKTLRLALRLASSWESTLWDANTPDNPQSKGHPDMQKTAADCLKNIAAFDRLLKKLDR